VALGWHLLEINVVLAECFFELFGAFVVEDVEYWSLVWRLVHALVISLAWQVLRGLERIALLSWSYNIKT
jgi:hypothetical protein